MKKFLILCVGLFFANAGFSQSKEQVRVAGAVEKLRLAMISGVREELESIVDDSLSYGHSGGAVEGKAEFVEKIASGKSDFVDQMVIGYNQQHSWKTAFASPENAPTYLHAHKLMRKAWQGMPSRKDIGTDKWEQTTEYINDNFYFIDMERYTLDSVLKKGAELVKRKGIKCLVIDPFNKVRDLDSNNGDVNVYTLEYLTKIEMFAKKYDVLVIIVAHPTKMYKDSNGKIEEPTMYNIKGGGEWYDASYHGLLVHRNYTNNTVKVKVLKVNEIKELDKYNHK